MEVVSGQHPSDSTKHSLVCHQSHLLNSLRTDNTTTELYYVAAPPRGSPPIRSHTTPVLRFATPNEWRLFTSSLSTISKPTVHFSSQLFIAKEDENSQNRSSLIYQLVDLIHGHHHHHQRHLRPHLSSSPRPQGSLEPASAALRPPPDAAASTTDRFMEPPENCFSQ